jgi:ribosome maturation factor RimP
MSLLDEPNIAQLREISEAVVKDNFLELFDLKVRVQGKKLVLTLVIDKKSGFVTVEECSLVSRDMEKRLDEMDLIQASYLLEVSSPGLDRPLRSLADCERFKGRLARLILSESLSGQFSFEGRLGEVDGEKVELSLSGDKKVWVPFSSVKTAQLVVEL